MSAARGTRVADETRCGDGLHVFPEGTLCECGMQAASVRAEGREGMVTVYDSLGQYLGCMGVETWGSLLDSEVVATS